MAAEGATAALALGLVKGRRAGLIGSVAGGAVGVAAFHKLTNWTEAGVCYSLLKGPNKLGQRWWTCRTCNATVCAVCADTRHAGHAVERKNSLVPKMGTCSTYNSTDLAAFSAAEVVHLTTRNAEGFCPVDCILTEITREKKALTESRIENLLSHSKDDHNFSDKCGTQCLLYVNEDPNGTGDFVVGHTQEHNGFVTVEWENDCRHGCTIVFKYKCEKDPATGLPVAKHISSGYHKDGICLAARP